jgi:protease I
VHILSDKSGQVLGMKHIDKADKFDVHAKIGDAKPDEYDALLLPGGVVNADALRIVAQAQEFARAIAGADKPIAVICHGAWLLASAELVDGKTLTSWPTLQDDLRNAGATWVDQEVCVEGRWVSSRKPDDIPAFNREMLKMFGQHATARAGRQRA